VAAADTASDAALERPRCVPARTPLPAAAQALAARQAGTLAQAQSAIVTDWTTALATLGLG
jgi:hypothetical protein